MGMNKTLPLLLLSAALAAMTGCESGPYYGDVRVHDRDYDVRVVFSDHDRGLIRDYYRGYYKGLPPGLAKKGKVPPGHAKKLYLHQPLPPGLEWRHLPDDLERRLSRLPDGYVRVTVGADVAIMRTHTRVVLDLIENLDD
jgi:hypothetical protein